MTLRLILVLEDTMILVARCIRSTVRKIVNYFAKTFGSHPAVKLWQIDNELGHHGSSALFTENSKVKFQKFLEEKYIKIENLNKVWATAFWSQGYTDFSQIRTS